MTHGAGACLRHCFYRVSRCSNWWHRRWRSSECKLIRSAVRTSLWHCASFEPTRSRHCRHVVGECRDDRQAALLRTGNASVRLPRRHRRSTDGLAEEVRVRRYRFFHYSYCADADFSVPSRRSALACDSRQSLAVRIVVAHLAVRPPSRQAPVPAAC